jgi:hypothetical protein
MRPPGFVVLGWVVLLPLLQLLVLLPTQALGAPAALRGANATAAVTTPDNKTWAAAGAAAVDAPPSDHQLTSVQSFINSYEQGTRFNDTSLVGLSGGWVVSPC